MAHRKRSNRQAFTLVELLVVISIIGMLAALLLPAVNAAREAGRRTTCNNSISQLCLANIAFENNRGRFPGYQEVLVPSTGSGASQTAQVNATWIIMTFPQMENQPLYDAWSDPANTANLSSSNFRPLIKALRCPSDPATVSTGPVNNYVANGGYFYQGADGTTTGASLKHADYWLAEDPSNGVFHDLVNRPGTYPAVATSIGSLVDGASQTVLVSESLLAGNWPDVAAGGAKSQLAFTWLYVTQADMAGPGIPAPDPAPSQTFKEKMKINGQRTQLTRPMDFESMRPSSQHPTGVNIGFADRHTQFLRDTIDYTVYQQLMTPYGMRSDMPFGKRLLKGEDY